MSPCRMIAALFLLANHLLLSRSTPIFAQTKDSIRSVDFYNFTYELDPHNKIVLRKGLSRDEPVPQLFSEEKLRLLKYCRF
jgi:hypothetical protein